MTDQTSSAQPAGLSQTRAETVSDFVDIELGGIDGSIDDEIDAQQSASQSKGELFAKSTDIRRRIEEKLEVRLLKDELGIENLDIE